MSEETPQSVEFTKALGFVNAQIGAMQDDEKIAIIEKLRPGADITVQVERFLASKGNKDPEGGISENIAVRATTCALYLDLLRPNYKDNSEAFIRAGAMIGQALAEDDNFLLRARLMIVQTVFSKTKNEKVRMAAATFMREMGDPAIDILISNLRNATGLLDLTRPVGALEAIGSAAVPKLISELGVAKPEVKRWIVYLLGQVGDESAVEALIATLLDTDERTRHEAKESLKKLTKQHFLFGEDNASKWRK